MKCPNGYPLNWNKVFKCCLWCCFMSRVPFQWKIWDTVPYIYILCIPLCARKTRCNALHALLYSEKWDAVPYILPCIQENKLKCPTGSSTYRQMKCGALYTPLHSRKQDAVPYRLPQIQENRMKCHIVSPQESKMHHPIGSPTYRKIRCTALHAPLHA